MRSYWKAKFIKNHFQEQFPYPEENFNDPELGPNIYQVIAHACKVSHVCAHARVLHQVTAMHIKKITTDYRPLPGVPWAIMKNFAKHGTPGLVCSAQQHMLK